MVLEVSVGLVLAGLFEAEWEISSGFKSSSVECSIEVSMASEMV